MHKAEPRHTARLQTAGANGTMTATLSHGMAPMPWWAWVVTGMVLFGAELFGVSAQFYLVFLGVAAIAVGLIGSLGVHLPEWAQFTTFAVLALVSMFSFRRRVYQRLRATPEDGAVEERLNRGDRVQVPETLATSGHCRVEYRGTSWSARNVGTQQLDAGSEAEIVEIDGLTLHLRKPP